MRYLTLHKNRSREFAQEVMRTSLRYFTNGRNFTPKALKSSQVQPFFVSWAENKAVVIL